MDTPLITTTLSADLFSSFLRTEDPGDSETALAALFATVVVPSVKSVLKHKMNVSLSADDTSARNLDALEIVSDVEAELLKKLRSLRDQQNAAPITNLEAYSRAAAANAFRQYLRDKYPLRRRLRNKIRYIFSNKKGYALWRSDDGESVCGTLEWRRANKSPINYSQDGNPRILIEIPGTESFDLDDNRKILLVLEELLKAANAPVGLNQAVNIVADVLGLEDAVETEIDDRIASDGQGLEEGLIQRWSLKEFWEDIVHLPIRHRTALLLNLRGEHGENILSFLPILRIASMRKIAEALDVAPEELARIWNTLPLDDNAIAERLGLTRQQVVNLRQSARSNLKRKRIKGK